MARVSTYLNFEGNTEEAFEFYKSVFETDYVNGIFRMGDIPPMDGMPPVPDHLKDKVMNVQLPIIGGHLLMGTDVIPEWGQKLEAGNNVSITILSDSRDDADRLFTALSEGGTVEMPMADQFWGDYYGSLVDKFGIRWMVDYTPAK
ncbi:MAG: VOC family protein [Thermomicrobiales bacterium]|nr:VOC family protein [Thermomicrobiales bacterium]